MLLKFTGNRRASAARAIMRVMGLGLYEAMMALKYDYLVVSDLQRLALLGAFELAQTSIHPNDREDAAVWEEFNEIEEFETVYHE